MTRFERGFDPPLVKLRGKVLATGVLYFLEVVKVFVWLMRLIYIMRTLEARPKTKSTSNPLCLLARLVISRRISM